MELVAFFAYRKTTDSEDLFDLVEKAAFPKFPNKIDLVLLWALREDDVKRSVDIVITSPNNQETKLVGYVSTGYSSNIVLYEHELITIEVHFSGLYRLRLQVDGETVSEYPIEVVKVES